MISIIRTNLQVTWPKRVLIIRSTRVPNYRAARIPISGLNIKAWETHLQDYSDKRVLQYIKFGYPLSIENLDELCNKGFTNHYSACQYPGEVQKYIDKEKSFGFSVKKAHWCKFYCIFAI